MKRSLLILVAFALYMPLAHAHHHDEQDKLQQCYRVESPQFNCDELDDDQLDEVIETGGLDGYDD